MVELYPQEEDLAELLLNASSAVKLEFNFRPKRFLLMTNGKKYTWDAMIGNAGIKINLIYRICVLQYCPIYRLQKQSDFDPQKDAIDAHVLWKRLFLIEY